MKKTVKVLCRNCRKKINLKGCNLYHTCSIPCASYISGLLVKKNVFNNQLDEIDLEKLLYVPVKES